MWLDFVTYLHHHGHEQQLPWYRHVLDSRLGVVFLAAWDLLLELLCYISSLKIESNGDFVRCCGFSTVELLGSGCPRSDQELL
ncbi:fatty acid desaturase (DSD1) [Sarracenia purpurea var. burkii]